MISTAAKLKSRRSCSFPAAAKRCGDSSLIAEVVEQRGSARCRKDRALPTWSRGGVEVQTVTKRLNSIRGGSDQGNRTPPRSVKETRAAQGKSQPNVRVRARPYKTGPVKLSAIVLARVASDRTQLTKQQDRAAIFCTENRGKTFELKL